VNEIDVFVAAISGGFVSSAIMVIVFYGQIRWAYEQKLKTLQMQIVALQVAVGVGE
jgi:hypothetical protein